MSRETRWMPAADHGDKAATAKRRTTSLVTALAIALAAEAGLIQRLSAHGDFLRQGEAWKFTAYGVAAGIAYWVAARVFTQTRLSAKQRVAVFWLAAVALRLVVLPVVPGDDVWRYRWEGMIQLHGVNPYRFSPDSPTLTPLRDADWSKINHREFPAIYPPLTEAIFAGLASLGNLVWTYKALFALADLAGIALLRRLLARSGPGADHAVWYAWNPLAAYAFAGAAHFDSLMILAMLGAIVTLDRFARLRPGPSALYWTSAGLLGLAVAVKIAPLALLPVWAVAGGSWRRAVGLVPVALAPLAGSALAYGFPGTPVFAALRQFGGGFRVNDPLWWLVDVTLEPSHPGGSNGPAGVCTLVVCLALTWWFRRDWRRGMFWVWGAVLLLSPVVHAWYVVWVLPLAAWRGADARAWFVFSISTFGYFLLWEVNHASGQPWREPLWLRLAILLPPLLAVAWTASARARQTRLNSDGFAATVPE